MHPQNTPDTHKISALVVTYNRKHLLLECLQNLLQQSLLPSTIVIVDSACTDGTELYIQQHIGFENKSSNEHGWSAIVNNVTVEYIKCKTNLGGAGGFNLGIKHCLKQQVDAIWIMDDDTMAKADTLKHLVAAPCWSSNDCGIAASLVHWTDGELHKMNVHGRTTGVQWLNEVEQTLCVPVESVSFVSILVKAEVFYKVGLPVSDFFIWYDDLEFCQRVQKHCQIFYSLRSHVVHKTPTNAGAGFEDYSAQNAWKFRYKIRNYLFTVRLSHQPLWKKLLRMAKHFAITLRFIERQQGPPKALLWYLEGLTTPLYVEFPEGRQSHE